MSHHLAPEPRIAALIAERARAAGLAVEARAIGAATVLTCDAVPGDVGFNRAFEVDAREPGVAAEIVAYARGLGRRPMLEIDLGSLGDAQRAELAALGISKMWPLVALRLDLASLPRQPPTGVTARAVRDDEADAFGALAVRAYGAPPIGFPPIDEAAEARKWATFVRLGRARCFFAEIDGVPCAIAMALRVGAVALVDGAATLAEHRGRGCQGVLLAHRFREARAEAARVAITRTATAASQRNLERAGMAVYRRMEVWGEPAGTSAAV